MSRNRIAISLARRLGGLGGAVLVSICLVTVPSVEAARNEVTNAPTSIELAQAFTAALNAHDVDAVVGMFTEEDSGPTVNADRRAWQKFEIRLWAQQQIAADIRAEAFDYRATEQGATWSANLYRDDWGASVEFVAVTNSIWVHNGQLADFSSTLSEPRDLQRLGDLWRPGAAPDRTAGV